MKKIKLMIAAGLLMILLLTFPLAAEDNLQILLTGIENYYQGNYEKALAIFSEDLSAEDIEMEIKLNILYYRALAQIELREINNALNTINLLKEHGYESGILYHRLGELYLNKNKQFDMPFYNDAKKYLEKAAALGNNSLTLHSDLATAYEGLDELEKAINEYEYILERDEAKVNYLNLASLYYKNGDIQKSIDYYTLAMKKGNQSTSLFLNLGELYLETRNYTKAIEVLEKGIQYNEDFPALYFTLGKSNFLNKDYISAKNHLSKVIQLNKNYYRAYYYLGQICETEKEWQDAIYYYEQAVIYNPDYADAYIALGRILLEQENYYKAISNFTLAIEKNETYPPGHYYLAVTYFKLNMKEAAAVEIRKTLHLNPDHKEAQNLLKKLQEDQSK